MRREAVIDLLLTDAAEALIRNRAKRPSWLPRGFPMKLILTLQRQALINHICDDPQLRKYLRVSSRHLLHDGELDLDAAGLNGRVQRSDDPHRLVATALVHEEEEIARAAAPWAEYTDQIPVVPGAVDEPRPAEDPKARRRAKGRRGKRSQVAADEVPAGEEVPPPEPEREPEPPEPVGDEPPAWDQRERLALIEERDELRRRVRQLEAQNNDLRSRVPSKSERRRPHKEHGQLKRIEAELADVRQELDALRSERDRLIELRYELEVQLEDAPSGSSCDSVYKSPNGFAASWR